MRFQSIEVMDLVAEYTEASTGLAYVPSMMIGVTDLEAAHKALLNAARMGLVELRPDSGSRFSRGELALAPPGPEGSRLLWARLI